VARVVFSLRAFARARTDDVCTSSIIDGGVYSPLRFCVERLLPRPPKSVRRPCIAVVLRRRAYCIRTTRVSDRRVFGRPVVYCFGPKRRNGRRHFAVGCGGDDDVTVVPRADGTVAPGRFVFAPGGVYDEPGVGWWSYGSPCTPYVIQCGEIVARRLKRSGDLFSPPFTVFARRTTTQRPRLFRTIARYY